MADKVSSSQQPINLAPWVLFTCPATLPGTINYFLERIRSSDRPFICIKEIPKQKYRYTVDFDLLVGLRNGSYMGFTEQGAAKIKLIMTSHRHKTGISFCAGSCYVYARYLSLEDAVEVANALDALVGVSGIWEQVYGDILTNQSPQPRQLPL